MISQAGFDEMVQENMEEFEMSKEEALSETIQQLQSMGKDLSAIDTTGGEIRNKILTILEQLKENVKDYDDNTRNETRVNSFMQLNEILFNKTPINTDGDEGGGHGGSQNSEKNQNIFGSSGGMIILLEYIDHHYHPKIVKLNLELILNLSKNNIQIRDLFEPSGSEKLCEVIAACYNSLSSAQDNGDDEETMNLKNNKLQLLKTCFRCAKVMSKSENNKVALVNNHLDVHLITFITSIHSSLLTYESSANDILKEICLTIKSLCTHDDLRKEMSCAYDNGKRFLNDDVVSALVNYSRNYQKNADVSACALSALRQLILSEEAVKMVCSHGLMTLPKQILQLDHAPVILIRSLVGLIRNICADDGRKNYLVSDGIVPLLIFYMSREEYQLDSQLMEHILATLAAIALRYPNNSHLIVTSGGIDEIVSIMRRYEQKVSLQRQACLTIRNIASRCPELRRRMLDCNVEVMLRHAGRHQECIDEAYAALRDLECEVQYVKLSTDGRGYESAYETFGTLKPKFNPVFEETYDIITRIDKEATAPFANPHGSSRLDEDDDNDDELEGHGNHHQHSDTCCH